MSATTEPEERYRLLAKWASGGMADVFVARQRGAAGFDKIVALKFLRDSGDGASFRDMFLDEVRTAALLNHPCIVQTFDAGELDERLFMAMEFVNGETLGRFARVVSRATGAFPVELAVAIARDLATALEYAHTLTDLDGVPLQLVHRDVSPSNILLSFDGMVKLLDFGIAKVATKLQATGVGTLKGKFSYMSPEQARGTAVDHRSDIYSLGIVLWQLLAGRPAHDAQNESELLWRVAAPKIEPPSHKGAKCNALLDEIVMAALAPDPADRYATAGDFATALSRYLTRHAAGFDANKLIRALMAANFADRRDRLTQLVRRGEDGPSISRTMTPSKVSNPSLVAVPVTIAPTTTSTRLTRSAWPVAVLVLAGAGLGGGYLAYRSTASTEPRVASLPASPPPVQAATRVASLPASPPPVQVATTPAPPPPSPSSAPPPEPRPAAATIDAHDRSDEPAPIAAEPARPAKRPPVRVAVAKPTKRADKSGDSSRTGRAEASSEPGNPASSSASASRGGSNPGSNAASRGGSNPGSNAASRGGSNPGSNAASSGGSNPGSNAASRGGSSGGSNAASSGGSNAASNGGSNTVSRGGSSGGSNAASSGGSNAASNGGSNTASNGGSNAGAAESAKRTSPPVAPSVPVAPEVGSLDATPAITKVAVDGSLPTSEIESLLARSTDALRACYRAAATKAHRTPALAVRISFVIDEGRAPHGVKVGGDTLGLASCVETTIASLRTRTAPDVGTVAVVAQISFRPTKK